MNRKRTSAGAPSRLRFPRGAAVVIVIAAAALAAARAPAGDCIWTGAADTAYTNDANWAGGAAPRNNDYQDRAIFKENSPANRTPALHTHRSVNGVRFEESTGWELKGTCTFMMKVLFSTGRGTNSFEGQLKNAAAGPWTTGPGNTFVTGRLFVDNSDLTVTGGGTFVVNQAIEHWAEARRIIIKDGTLRVAASRPFAGSAAAVIDSASARLQLRNTVAGARALIGTRVIDNVGRGLCVAEIGGGYVEISVAPRALVIMTR